MLRSIFVCVAAVTGVFGATAAKAQSAEQLQADLLRLRPPGMTLRIYDGRYWVSSQREITSLRPMGRCSTKVELGRVWSSGGVDWTRPAEVIDWSDVQNVSVTLGHGVEWRVKSISKEIWSFSTGGNADKANALLTVVKRLASGCQSSKAAAPATVIRDRQDTGSTTVRRAVPLWQNVSSGMAEAQLRVAQPGVRPEPVTFDGPDCSLSLANQRVGGQDYKVCFVMGARGLDYVRLDAKNASRPDFDMLLGQLRSQHGREISTDEPLCSTSIYASRCEAKWNLRSGVSVIASYWRLGAEKWFISIRYEPQAAQVPLASPPPTSPPPSQPSHSLKALGKHGAWSLALHSLGGQHMCTMRHPAGEGEAYLTYDPSGRLGVGHTSFGTGGNPHLTLSLHVGGFKFLVAGASTGRGIYANQIDLDEVSRAVDAATNEHKVVALGTNDGFYLIFSVPHDDSFKKAYAGFRGCANSLRGMR